MLKKIIAVIAVLSLVACLFGACTAKDTTKTDDGDGLDIVCTIFPLYDWVQNIIADTNPDAKLTLLLDSGIDLHSYQTTAEDMMKISKCDVFVYIGGESDKWVEDVAKAVDLSGVLMVNASELLGDALRDEVEGLEDEAEEEEEDAFDEHIWLSLKNAQAIIPQLAAKIGEKDEQNADAYNSNAAAYCEKLASLDAEYAAMAENASTDTLVFADRFPFVYLFEDYNISFVSAFTGCSTDTNASPNTILKLADALKAAGNGVLMMTETCDGKIADTVKEAAGDDTVKVLTLHSLQSVTADKIGTVNYLDVMQENLNVLKEALS